MFDSPRLSIALSFLLIACSDSDGSSVGSDTDAADSSADLSSDATADMQDMQPDVVDDQGGVDATADPSDDAEDDVSEDPGADAVADAANPDAVADVADEEVLACDGTCPAGVPLGGMNMDADLGTPRPQDVIIVAVDFETERVVVRNVSGDAFTASGWQVCQGAGTYQSVVDLVFANDGDELVLDLRAPVGPASGNVVNLGLSATYDLDLADSFALYRSGGGFADGQNMEAYVRWAVEGQAPVSGRQAAAQSAMLWDAGVVSVCPTNGGIVATGLVTNSANWADAGDPVSCF